MAFCISSSLTFLSFNPWRALKVTVIFLPVFFCASRIAWHCCSSVQSGVSLLTSLPSSMARIIYGVLLAPPPEVEQGRMLQFLTRWMVNDPPGGRLVIHHPALIVSPPRVGSRTLIPSIGRLANGAVTRRGTPRRSSAQPSRLSKRNHPLTRNQDINFSPN